MKRIKDVVKVLVVMAVSLSGVPLAQVKVSPYYEIQAAYAQEDWKKEFEDICSRTDDAMSFTKDELRNLIARCDNLKSVIEKLDESAKKVYMRRLQMCRDMLAFVLESKEKN